MAIRGRSQRTHVQHTVHPCQVPIDVVSLFQRLTVVFASPWHFLVQQSHLDHVTFLVSTRFPSPPPCVPLSLQTAVTACRTQFTIIGLSSDYSPHSRPFVRSCRVHPFILAPLNIINIYPSPQSFIVSLLERFHPTDRRSRALVGLCVGFAECYFIHLFSTLL